jgi:hypothetical protein
MKHSQSELEGIAVGRENGLNDEGGDKASWLWTVGRTSMEVRDRKGL